VHFPTRKSLPRKRLKQERLRAAYQAGGLSWHKLASTAGVSHPVLSRVLSAKTKAVNAATLKRLAKALRVPAEWLTGEQGHLPYVPEWDSLVKDHRKGSRLSNWERPTADHVRWSWLMQRIERAVRRDLQDWYGAEAGHAYNSWGHAFLHIFSEAANALV